MAPKTRKVEMLVAWDDHTWSTVMIDIPMTTVESELHKVAEQEVIKKIGRSDTGATLVLTAIYSIPDLDWDEIS